MKPVLVISDRDNVATALERLEPGRRLQLGSAAITVREAIPPGHKVALRALSPGESVVKYGSPIGTATERIEPGAHVHVHNVSSSRGRGDLGGGLHRRTGEAAPRLAEPPDTADAAETDASEPALLPRRDAR